MDKIIYQDSNDALTEAVSRNGEAMVSLIETDTGVKSAASNLIKRSMLEEYRPKDDSNVLIHLIGMGNSQQYGYNRNGDWFDGPVLEKRAHTFVTHGKMYREHRNKDPKKAIGEIKYAAYDPKMQRVEILVHMSKDKAPEEYEMAKKGSALNFSMSCRVPNDRCSCCGNKAKTISKYCDHLKNHMGQWIPGIDKYAFAYNDEPTFFDISRVKNPADRIARHLGYLFNEGDEIQKEASEMCKAASAGDILIPGAVAAMAEGVNLDTLSLEEQAKLVKLAAAEEYIADTSNIDRFYTDKRANAVYGSYPFSLMDRLTEEELKTARKVSPETFFGQMAKRACMLSFPAFCQYVSGDPHADETDLCKKAALMLPDMFRHMASRIMTIRPITSEFAGGSDFRCENDPGNSDLVQNFMNKAEEKFSLRDDHVKRRVLTIVIRISIPDHSVGEKLEKAASCMVSHDQASTLAEAYGQYQIRALCDIDNRHGESVVNDNMYDIVAGANSVRVFDR